METELDTIDGPLPLYVSDVTGSTDARTAAIVIQEAFGVGDHVRDVADRLAARGYYAVAPQLFHRDGVNALPYDDFDLVKPHLAKLTADGVRTDIEATVNYLTAQRFSLGSTGILGFCTGGSVVVAAGADRAFGAAVTFYGGGITEGRFGFPPLAELAPLLKSPWLGMFGDLDASIPPEQVELLRVEATKAPVPTSVVRYAEAGHGFHCDARPAAYHEASAKDAWAKTLDWFVRFLQPRR